MYLKEMTRLNAALNALYMEQDDIYSAYAAHFGLSGTAFWILYAICESDEVKTQNALADAFHMPRQSINSAAAALAKQGYVALEQLPGAAQRQGAAADRDGQGILRPRDLPVFRN